MGHRYLIEIPSSQPATESNGVSLVPAGVAGNQHRESEFPSQNEAMWTGTEAILEIPGWTYC